MQASGVKVRFGTIIMQAAPVALLLFFITPTDSKHSTLSQYNNTENLQKHEIKNRIKSTTIYKKHKCFICS